jgi:hypothetical protein
MGFKGLDRRIVALTVFTIISLLFCYYILINLTNWGVHDWDQHLFYHGVPRRTIVEFKQFPLWNPYYCGGNVMLANPQSMFLSPMFLVALMLGEVVGLKIEIILHFIIGMFGMWLVGKELGFGKISSYLPAFVYILSSIYALHIAVGHTVWMPVAFLPYVFLFYIKSNKEKKYLKNAVMSSLFLVLIFLGSGIYIFLFTILFLSSYSLLETIKNRNMKAIKTVILVFVIVIMVSAVKIIPMIEFLGEYAQPAKHLQPTSLSTTLSALLSRDQAQKLNAVFFYYKDDKFPWGWHEYGTYIGIIPLLLFVTGSVMLFKRYTSLIVSAILFFVLSLGNSFPLSPWLLLHRLPVINSLHGPSRFILVFVFCSAIIAGAVLSRFEKKSAKIKIGKYIISSRVLVFLVVAGVLIDLMLVGIPIFKDAFTVTPKKINRHEFTQVLSTDIYNSQYPNMLSNVGTVNCYERVHPEIKAIPRLNDKGVRYVNYKGEAYMAETNKRVMIKYFSPNKVVVEAEKGLVVLNQNYVRGWQAKGGNVLNYDGLVAAEVETPRRVVFYYLPKSFIIGLTVTIISVILLCAVYYKDVKNEDKSKK